MSINIHMKRKVSFSARSNLIREFGVHLRSIPAARCLAWKIAWHLSQSGMVNQPMKFLPPTWFFSMPPATQTAPVRAAAPAQAERAESPIDIQQEAARLKLRMPTEPRYSEPARNPFRFTAPRQPERPAAAAPPSAAAPVAPLPPPPPQISLDGIASDTVDGQMQRSAILNTSAGVVIAKEGDDVAGYRVNRVAPDSVELTKTGDGSVLRLGLR